MFVYAAALLLKSEDCRNNEYDHKKIERNEFAEKRIALHLAAPDVLKQNACDDAYPNAKKFS